MKKLRNFMLRLIGIYIPFILVFLGIAGCGYFYRDTILDRFNNDDPVIQEPIEEPTEEAPTEPELQTDVADDERSRTFDDVVTEEEIPEEVPDDQSESPAIGECECICSETAGTL